MSTLQRLHGLPNSGASLTAPHPLEPKIPSHAEGDIFIFFRLFHTLQRPRGILPLEGILARSL